MAGGEGKKPLWRRIVPWIVGPAVLGPLGIFAFILTTEVAHNEDACPPERVSVRNLGPGVSIEEQSRNCFGDIHERRFLLHRASKTQLLGRRRFEQSAFDADAGYGWDAGIADSGEVQMYVTTPGHGGVAFREGTPEEAEGLPAPGRPVHE